MSFANNVKQRWKLELKYLVAQPYVNTGIELFAECPKHSAKSLLHSANSTRDSCDDEEGFAECLFSDTRQSLCRVPKCSRQNKVRGPAKLSVTRTLPSARQKDTRQSPLLCHVPSSWHTAKMRIKKYFNSGKILPPTFFARYATVWIRTRNLRLACNLLYHCTTYTTFSFPIYYTKSRVNWLFEALNRLKLKSCQL
jgi:hypothetical protein